MILGLTAFPFLPGQHDASARPLSGLARGVGFGSLILVPLGILWTVVELRAKSDAPARVRITFLIAALIAMTLAVSLGGLLSASLSGGGVGMMAFIVWASAVWRRRRHLLEWARTRKSNAHSAGVILIVVPAIVAGSQFLLAPALASFAWNRTMDGLSPLIADLERYRATNGHYPRSLFSEWCDYRPAIIGVGHYLYEPSGEAYNLAVEVPTFSIDSREFLVYNPADAHAMASHDADLLLRPADQLPFYRGYSSARALERPHWKLLSFD